MALSQTIGGAVATIAESYFRYPLIVVVQFRFRAGIQDIEELIRIHPAKDLFESQTKGKTAM